MKIIAKMDRSYLVEATAHELANAAGYKYARDLPAANPDGYGGYNIAIGTTVKVAETHRYLQNLREQEGKVRDSAAVLRGMADMMTAALPTTIVPPPAAEEPHKEA